MMAFACNDQARNLRGKLPQIEYWKTTCEFVGWVITLQKERNEPELEGLWYFFVDGADVSHQLQAICQQRLFEDELQYLRNRQKGFERQRSKEGKEQIEADDMFWRVWTESTVHYAAIADAFRRGQRKLSEVILKDKFPETWRDRNHWGTEKPTEEEEFATKYRLPLGSGTTISESIGFAQSILKEFVVSKGMKYSFSDM
jgi:hypothetical protein